MVRLGCLRLISWRLRPSMSMWVFSGLATSMVSTESAGKTMGRKMLSGQMGVSTKAFTPGSRTGPPADRE